MTPFAAGGFCPRTVVLALPLFQTDAPCKNSTFYHVFGAVLESSLWPPCALARSRTKNVGLLFLWQW